MMNGLNIIRLNHVGFNGISLNSTVSTPKQTESPTFLSAFGTGIWEDEGYWFDTDKWRNEPQNAPFLSMGVWNNEGVYRFRDNFSFGMSFLPTGIFIFDGIFRFKDIYLFKKIRKYGKR